MQADGSGQAAVPGSGPLDTLYGWAPDGRWLLVESSRDVNLEIYAVAPDGSRWVNLTRDRAQDQWPSWSPDGTKIAFVSDRGGEGGRFINQVCVLELATDQVKRLTDERYGATAPAWSPDGKQIAFSRVRDDAYGYMDVWAMDADGRHARQLTDRQAWAFPETWSPDGRELIITRISAARPRSTRQPSCGWRTLQPSGPLASRAPAGAQGTIGGRPVGRGFPRSPWLRLLRRQSQRRNLSPW